METLSPSVLKVLREQKSPLSEQLKPRKKRTFAVRSSGGEIHIGNVKISELFAQRAKLVSKEIKISCIKRSLCPHLISDFKILTGEIGRQNRYLYPDEVILLSDHYRTHIFDTIEKYGDLKSSERGTEHMNQIMMKVAKKSSKIRDQEKQIQHQLSSIEVFRQAKPINKMFVKSF